jgi:hypothetical protein
MASNMIDINLDLLSVVALFDSAEISEYEAQIESNSSIIGWASISPGPSLNYQLFSKVVSSVLRIPYDVGHSYQALKEAASDLSWLEKGRYAISIDCSPKDLIDQSFYLGLNALIRGLSTPNSERLASVTIFVFL